MKPCSSRSHRLLPFLLLTLAAPLGAQQPAQKAAPDAARAKLVAAARQIMNSQKFCAFITVDRNGRAQVRTINPFPPDDDMVVWFATGIQTQKVAEIKANPHVAVYYADHQNGTGYVQLSGTAVLVSDKAEIDRHRRAYWAQAFPNDRNLVLVKVVPEHVNVINYAAGAVGDSITWHAPAIEFPPKP